MKIKRFFAIIVALCLFLTGCSKSVDWDKDIQKLENAGYTVTYHTSEEELASITHELNSWAKFNGYDLTFEVEKYTDLLKDNDYDDLVNLLNSFSRNIVLLMDMAYFDYYSSLFLIYIKKKLFSPY